MKFILIKTKVDYSFWFCRLARTGSCSRLTFLDLSGCNQITDVGLQRLGDCFRLEAGTMDCKTCESCCKSCNSRPVICDADFTDEDELGFCDTSPGIGYLNLSGCLFVTDFGLQSLLEVSLHMNSLHFMDLSGCSLVSGDALVSIVSRSSKLQPKDLYYCNMIEGGPYPTEANGCQNLICPLRRCCCTGD